MNRTQFDFLLPLVFGIIGVVLGGILAAGHRLHAATTDRRRCVGAFLVKGFRRHTARNLLILGAVLAIVGAIGVVAAG